MGAFAAHTQLGTNSWGPKAWQLCLKTSGVGLQANGAAKITRGRERLRESSTGREQHRAARGLLRVLTKTSGGQGSGEREGGMSWAAFPALSCLFPLEGWLLPPTDSGPRTHTK